MKNQKQNYPEINAIQEDLSSLKSNTVDLANHVKDDSMKTVSKLSGQSAKMYDRLKARSRKEIGNVEDSVRDNPLRGVAIAFAGGLIASLFLRGK